MAKGPSGRKVTKSSRARRERAERLFAAGERQIVVARLLGVSRQCVHNWFRLWKGGTLTAPTGPGRSGSGRKPRLSAEQLALVDAGLRRGPRHYGFRTGRWTLDRVATAIERISGIRFHPSSVWRILRALGWTLRYPPRQPGEQKAYVAREWVAPTDGQAADGRPPPRPGRKPGG